MTRNARKRLALPSYRVLRAYKADGLSEIRNSDMADDDGLGAFVKFVNTTVADGKVFVPRASNQLVVYSISGGGPVSTTPVVMSIVNVASYAGGGVAPGEMLAIQGSNLGPADLVINTLPAGASMSSTLAGTQVLFNDIPGPVFYSSPKIIAAIVPYAVADATAVKVKIVFNGKTSQESTLPVVAAAPGLFSADSSGNGPGSILNADYSLTSEENPGEPEGIVVLYGTGGGLVKAEVSDGATATGATPLTGETLVTGTVNRLSFCMRAMPVVPSQG